MFAVVANNQAHLPWPLGFIWAFFLTTAFAVLVTKGRAYGVVARLLQLAFVGTVAWFPIYLWMQPQPHGARNLAVDIGATLGVLVGFTHALFTRKETPPRKPQPFEISDYAITLFLYLAFVYVELRDKTGVNDQVSDVFLRYLVSFAVAQLTIGLLYRILSFVLKKDFGVSRNAHYALLAVPMALSLVVYAIAVTWPVAVLFNLILLYLSWRLTDKRPQSVLTTLLDVWRYLRSDRAVPQATTGIDNDPTMT